MIVPKVDPSTAEHVLPELAKALDLLPSQFYTQDDHPLPSSSSSSSSLVAVWADVKPENAQERLNGGLSVAVLLAESVSDLAKKFDPSRIAVRLPPASNDFEQLLNDSKAYGTVVLTLSSDQIEAMKSKQLANECRVLVELDDPSQWSLKLIQAASEAGVDPVVPAHLLTVAAAGSEKIPLAEALIVSSGLNTDRLDELYTTVVVDEQQACLGVCYSNQASLSAALESGLGVYWSRRRGLWRKGATSGATQQLVGIRVDCDADTLYFQVRQQGNGFCHRGTYTCFGPAKGLSQLALTVADRKENAPEGSYTHRLFNDPQLLHAKLLEEATELVDATEPSHVAFEAADLIYFAMVKCAAHGVSLADIERSLDRKHQKVVRRPGNAKPQFVEKPVPRTSILNPDIRPVREGEQIKMRVFTESELKETEKDALLQRPIIDSAELMGRVRPIVDAVRVNGDKAVLEYTAKFDRAQLDSVVLRAPFKVPDLSAKVQAAIDQAYSNIHTFHQAQLGTDTSVETMPGIRCGRFSRAIERVGLYVPGGTAVLPSTALMLGVPAQVAGCREIVIATPPRSDGSVVPEVLYVAQKVGATAVVRAGGAQAIAAMAYGTETVPKVDKICGPGNQYVTAAKMLAQNDTAAMVAIDMPAGPSEVLVVADATSNPAFVASDLLSQAEHGPDSQVVLLAVDLNDQQLAAIEQQIHEQASRLPRVSVVRQSIPKSYCLRVTSMQGAMEFSNAYGPEHLILQNDRAADYVKDVVNAGSVFVGSYSPESCGDYASGTNHTLPTYGFSKMYSGVNTGTFLKYITSQELTPQGLSNIGKTVMTLAEVEELEAHRNAVAIRLRHMQQQ